MSDNRPIGVFDSGVGGITVLNECIRLLPNEKFIYFGDTARAPYGNKSKEIIINYAKEIVDFLSKFNIKAIVTACNTESAYALEDMRKQVDCPVLGVIQPGARMAVKITSTKQIAVIATSATVRSKAYSTEIKKLDAECEVLEIACPKFVPLIEDGLVYGEGINIAIREYLGDIKDTSIDTLVLGCTHFPHIEDRIKKFLPNVNIINPANDTALELRNILEAENLLSNARGNVEIFCSQYSEMLEKICNSYEVRVVEI